ncbi:MAG: PAS domain S-box protein [Gemmataceae bacterium]
MAEARRTPPPVDAAELARVGAELNRAISDLTSMYVYAATLHADGAVAMEWVAGAFERITSYTLEEINARGWPAVVHPEDLPRAAEFIPALKTNGSASLEFRLLKKTGQICWLRAFARPEWDPQHERAVRILGAVQDITEHKQAEAELRARQQVLQTIFDHVPVMIVFSDERGRISMANRFFERLTGWPVEEALTRDMLEELYPGEEGRRVFAFIRNPPATWGDFRLRTRDGRFLDTLWANVLLEDGTSIGIGLDVTERRRAEAERERLLREVVASREQMADLPRRLVEAQETERRGLARELHDEIGQILTTVHLSLEALKGKVEPSAWPRLDESLHVVNRAIEQVRDLSLNLRPASLDLLGLEPALRAFVSRQVAHAGLTLEFVGSLAGKRPPPALELVAFRLVQEAVTNVLRHSKATHCRVEIGVGDAELYVRVTDNGVGFDVSAMRRRAQGGDGFGLLSMTERVQLVGGRIHIDSTPGRGAAIHAFFPWPQAREAAPKW